MTTARDVITQAMKDIGAIGVGQTPSAEDITDGFVRLNGMISQWAQKRWIVYHLINQVFTATGAVSYSIGLGGDIDTTRPAKVQAAFFRLQTSGSGNAVDYQLEVLNAREDYNRIALKQMNSFPVCLFYDSGYPLGHIYIWPVPNSSYEIHLTLKQPLTQFTNLSDTVVFPPEYEEAMRLNLAVRLSIPFQLPIQPQLAVMAKASLNVLRQANAQIPLMRFPSDLPGKAGGRYNIFSDQGG